MKKWILFLMAIVAIQVSAADYTYKYLVFTASDGTKTSVSTEGLTLSVKDGSLVATTQTGTTTLTLASLAKMQFSVDDTTTTIDQSVESLTTEDPVDVYTVSGMYKGRYANVGRMKTSLRTGLYVIKQNGRSTKIIVK